MEQKFTSRLNFAACHRSDAMVAKKVEYRSGSQIWRYRCFASDGLCRLSGVALGFQTPPPPHRWPLEAVMASRHLQAPESGSQHSRKLWTHKTLNGLWRSRRASRASRHLRAPREESGGHQGSCRASRHLSALRPGDMGRARLPCATRHPDVDDLWRPVRRLNGLPDNFAHPTGPLKTARHRQTKPDKTLSSI